MAETTLKAFKPLRHVHEDWRGGQIRSIAATVTIRLHSEANIIRDYTGISLALVTGLTVGDPVICRVTGTYPYAIAEVRWGRPAPGAPSDQAAAVARDEFWAGTVSYSMFGEDDYWWTS